MTHDSLSAGILRCNVPTISASSVAAHDIRWLGQPPSVGHDRVSPAPNLNAFAERFVRSIKEECLSRMIFFGPASLQHAVRQFMAHYHSERNPQGLENRLPRPASVTALPHHPVQRRQRLGGMLRYYHRAAA